MAESTMERDGPLAERLWSFKDAEARLGEVVRRACDSGPQRITLDGGDAVVVVAAEIYDRGHQPHRTGRRLVDAMASSLLRDIGFERLPLVAGPVRDVEV